jgi:tetratricopeptide (TPR) repeat protein
MTPAAAHGLKVGVKAAPQATLDPYLYELVHPYWSAPPTSLPEIILPEAITDSAVLADAELYYQEGKAKFDNREWVDSISQFDLALTLNPRHSEAYNFRGAAYRHIGREQNNLSVYLEDNSLAILDFTRATLVSPTWWRAFNNRGVSYMYRAEVEPIREYRQAWLALAMNDFNQAMVLTDEEDGPACNRSFLYSEMGMCEEAKKGAVECSSMATEVFIRYAKCTGDYQLASVLLNEQLENVSSAEKAETYHQLGQICLKTGKYEEALKFLDLSQATWQGDFPPGYVLFEKAEAEYYLGNYQQAKEYILSGEGYTWIRWGMPYYYLGMIIWQEGNQMRLIIWNGPKRRLTRANYWTPLVRKFKRSNHVLRLDEQSGTPRRRREAFRCSFVLLISSAGSERGAEFTQSSSLGQL